MAKRRTDGSPDLKSVLHAVGDQISACAEHLRAVEESIFSQSDIATDVVSSRNIQRIDEVIQVLEEIAPFLKATAQEVVDDNSQFDAVKVLSKIKLDHLRDDITEGRQTARSGFHPNIELF